MSFIDNLNSFKSRMAISSNPGLVTNYDLKEILSLIEESSAETVFESVIMQGISDTTTSKLSYGVNTITNATSTAYATRLPFPPIKGKSLTVVNTSGVPIVVYPSVTGGSINGVINGSALVPSDGKSYTFLCYENPLPGAWSWTPPATNQWDSGDLLMTSLSPTGYVTAVSGSIVDLSSDNSMSPSYAFGGKNKALIINDPAKGYVFKPSVYWNQVTRIKIYTNTNAPGSYYLKYGYSTGYYNISTGLIVGNGVQGSGDISNQPINSDVSGSFVPSTGQTYISDFIGDPGTKYANVSVSPLNGISGIIGDKYLGQTIFDGNTVDVWVTGYIKFVFVPNGSVGNIPNVKFRFFIEYN